MKKFSFLFIIILILFCSSCKFFNDVKEDSRVFIKLNLVGPFPKDTGITTHPVILQAVIQLVKEKTNNIIVGDNPATRDMIYTLKKCNLYDVIQEEKVELLKKQK